MNPPDPTRLSATHVAQHFRFRCGRLLRYEITPAELRAASVPPAVPQPGAALLREMGSRWERRATARAIGRAGAEHTRFAGWADDGSPLSLPSPEVVATLRDPGAVTLLVQPQLRLPDPAAFARRFGVPETVAVADAQPDLLRVRRRGDGTPLFGVVDIKGSHAATTQHFAQVAFYTLLLEELLRQEGIDGVVERRWGWVWTRAARRPRRFALGAYRFHVERFLRDELPPLALLDVAQAPWHVGATCGGCHFLPHCRAEADRTDDLARVPGITPLAKQTLHERGIRTVAEMARSHRRDTYTGCHALEAGEARLRKQAQALAWKKIVDAEAATPAMGTAERVRVSVCAEVEPVHGLCFALGVRTDRPGGAPECWSWTAERPTAEAERDGVAGLLARIGGALEAARADAAAERGTAPFGLFVWDRAEMERLRALLQRHLADPALRVPVSAVLGALAPAADTGGTAPVTVLADAVAALWALPIPYAYDLASVSRLLVPAAGSAEPLGSEIGWPAIHRAWRSDDAAVPVHAEIAEAVRAKLDALDSVTRAVRERAARRGRERLRLRPFAPTAPEAPLRHRALETLRVFTRMEAAAEAAAVHALHARPAAERARRGECLRGMEIVDRRPDGQLVFEFDAECRDAKFRPGDFTLVLTNEGTDTLGRLAREPWLKRRLMVELVEYDLAASPPRVVLAPGSGFARAEAEGGIHLDRRCTLDRAAVDFATGRLLATLGALDRLGAAGESPAMDLLEGRNPPGWTPPWGDGEAAWRELMLPEAERRGAPLLNPDQAHAWRAVFREPVSLVWGPPGTGKTYLLAWVLLGIAAAARRLGRPCRIGVAAATHRAIANVLLRLEAERAGAPVSLRALKLQGSGSEADEELRRAGVEVCADAALPALLADAEGTGEPLVVGCTVWSLWKQMRALAGGTDADPVHPCFDVVVIDEASQMTVAQSLVALSALRPGGQVVLSGDHRQLAPVTRGRVDAGAPSLWGSAFAHFAEFWEPLGLRESRRMNRALVAYPRELFYPGFFSHAPRRRITLCEGPAAADAGDDELARAFLAPDDAVVLCTYRGVRAGARNLWEARMVARLAGLLRERLADPETGARYTAERFASHGLAVLAPHRAQNAAILAELLAAGWPADALPTVDTVERMQGNEREAILVSYGVADAEYAEAEAEFLLNPNRFNVAITRARAKLIVFVSDEVLGVVPRDEAVMTASLALKGYAAHCDDAVRDIDLPGFGAVPVRATLRYRRITATTGGSVEPGAR